MSGAGPAPARADRKRESAPTYCPCCREYAVSEVLESRWSDAARSIRRRRRCAGCDGRFTTFESFAEINVKTPTRLMHLKDQFPSSAD